MKTNLPRGVTQLRCDSPLVLAKTWKADGTLASYSRAKNFSVSSQEVGGIHALSRLLTHLESDRQACIIRGEMRPNASQEQGGRYRRTGEAFEDAPRHWLALDIDDFEPQDCDPVAQPAEAVGEFLQAHVPEFATASHHWQLTGSAGHAKAAGKLKARAWFWLEEPRTSAQLKAWAKKKWPDKPPFDLALFSATQVHYTAAPIFEAGVSDPVKLRSGFVKREQGAVNVPLVQEPTRQPSLPVSPSSGGGGTAYDLAALAGIYRDIEECPEGQRNQHLYQKARRAFSFVHAGRAEKDEVRLALQAAALASGLEADEIEPSLASAWGASQKKPDDLPPLAGDEFDAEPLAEGEEEREKYAQSDKIVAFVRTWNELFHDDNDVAYARDRQTGEVRPVTGRAFRNWLTAAFYEQYEKAVRDQSLREAKMTLEGLAMQEHRPVHVRVAGEGSGGYWLDLGIDGDSRAVHLRPGAWSVESAGLMFCRSDSAQPLPIPASGGNIELLWRIANVPEDAHLLVIAWLVECLRPDTPYPVVELLGEHGSAKSTAQAALRRLIDPNAADLRGVSKVAEDLFVTGGANHLISMENVSHLPAPLQDAMCVIATGGGFAKRKLYTDGDESVISLKRPIILNGIAAAVTQQDLVSRTLTIEMPVIQSTQAKDKLETVFEAHRASILGGLLDIAAKALEYLPEMKLPDAERPRLVEFAYLGMAVAKAMGRAPAEFMRQFDAARQDGLERTLEASPVATAIRNWAESHSEGAEMSVGQWLEELMFHRPQGSDAWPRTPKGLGDAMRRAAPALRGVGVECRCLGNIGGKVKWRIGQRNLPIRSQESAGSESGKCSYATAATPSRRYSLDGAGGHHLL